VKVAYSVIPSILYHEYTTNYAVLRRAYHPYAGSSYHFEVINCYAENYHALLIYRINSININ
jgi:hypothetical protein